MKDLRKVGSDAKPDNVRLEDDGKHTTQACSAPNMAQGGDLMDLTEPVQEGPVNLTHEVPGARPQGDSGGKSWIQNARNYLGFSPSGHSTQEESYIMTIESLRGHLQEQKDINSGLGQDLERVGRRMDHQASQLASAEWNVGRLRQERDSARQDNQSLFAQCTSLIQNHETELKATNEAHQNDTAQLRTQINDLTRRNEELRQMIIPISEKQIPDSEVASRFRSLRITIRGFVRQTWTTALEAGVDLKQLNENQQAFFMSSIPLSHERLGYLVFRAIYLLILRRPNYFLRDGLEKLQDRLGEAENDLSMNLAGANFDDLMEWRNATFKATESLRDNTRKLSAYAHRKTWDFLSPLKMRENMAKQTANKKLEAICDKAAELSLMMRQMQDDFQIDNLEHVVDKPIGQWIEIAEDVESVPTPQGSKPETIAFVIHGALTKISKNNLKKKLVLEKAEVAVYE